MKILLDDITGKKNLAPFTATRSVADIRVGILTIREKWEKLSGKKIHTTSEANPDPHANETVLISANIIPSQQGYNSLLNKQATSHTVLEYPWHIFQYNGKALKEDFDLICKDRKSQPLSSTNKAVTPENIFIEEGAIIEHSILNASEGPIYIGKNALMMEGCLIRGPFAMCERSTLKMGTKIYGATTIGPYCLAGGEIKNSVLLGYSNKAHDGYLGDSVIGEWCNLGAGTSNSNIKNTAGIVKVWVDNEDNFLPVDIKCGLLMGDYSRSAINTSFNTGTVVGVCCNVFCEGFPNKYIPHFTWGNQEYILDKAILDIDNWKKLKGKSISDNEIKILTDIYYSQKTGYA
jgi:UDP-N-acetylglucosamine diphosphorylase/glucosamine-1-phosphate N-acetyltransferase